MQLKALALILHELDTKGEARTMIGGEIKIYSN
jgi:hypothetical protein